jgi:Golgi phosphoprotein 3 (GPP34)
LVTDDATGRLLVSAAQVDLGLGGANLVELVLLGKVGLSGEGGSGAPGRIIIRDHAPTGDQVLDNALQTVIAHQGKKPSTVIRPLSKNLRPALYQRLAGSGVLQAKQVRMLGVFPAHRWPALDTSHKTQVRTQLTDVLMHQAVPDSRTAALIALAHALRCEDKVVDPQRCALPKRQLSACAAQIAKDDWASEAVRKVIDETIAAVAAATSAAAASTG